MAESLEDLLKPHLSLPNNGTRENKTLIATYTTRLCSLAAPSLTTTEPASLDHESQSSLRSLQALAKRSHRSIHASASHLTHLRTTLPSVLSSAADLQAALPELESASESFTSKYSKPSENPSLARRRKATLLNANAERIADILEIPTLLSSLVSAPAAASVGASANASTGAGATATANYASALDLHAHKKRLRRLHPDSALVRSVAEQADDAMKGLAVNLISALRAQSLKLAGAMRLVGLLRRVAPELEEPSGVTAGEAVGGGRTAGEGSFGALFLVCRLANLNVMLEALEPLRELADQESRERKEKAGLLQGGDDPNAWAAGQQTERYLKRYVEVFREQCFAIVSMCKSVFSIGGFSQDSAGPAEPPRRAAGRKSDAPTTDPLHQLPPTLSTFIAHLVDMLMETLREYLPNVRDQSSRNSLLTQVLYCAGSLGRHGGDFGMMLALLLEELEESDSPDGDDADADGADDTEPEWIDVMKRHRVQAGRLELLASGVGTKAYAGATREVASPG